jgi:transposase
MGVGCREAMRLLRIGCGVERTYRKALQAEGLWDGDPADLPDLETLQAAVRKHRPARSAPQQTSSIASWSDEIARMVKKGASPKAIYDRLRLDHGDAFPGSLSAVKRRVLRLKAAAGVQAEDVAIPVETAPGQVAQVDFGYAGYLHDPETGQARKAWVFVMVLGYSRHQFSRLVFDQKTETWLRLHEEAFAAFGGCPQTVVPDNLKAAVVRAAFAVDEGCALNRSYRELARYYGFQVDPTPPRDPKKKGKVESAVRYVKRNFLRPRDPSDIRDANRDLDRWVREVAGLRTHGTTGLKPLEVFEAEERAMLRPLPPWPYERIVWKEAKVHSDSHIQFQGGLYSVPWTLIGQSVWVQATDASVTVYADDVRVATHPRRRHGKRSTVDGHLPEHRVDYRYRTREYWEERAEKLGPEAGFLVSEVFAADEVLSQLRTVQAIVTLLEGFPRERALRACARARYFGNLTYGGLKRILKEGLDLEPLPYDDEDRPQGLVQPRFARPIPDLFASITLEERHASHG